MIKPLQSIYKIDHINSVIKNYFTQNVLESKISAKDLMPEFINAGIFDKDEKNGLPIRKILRELDRTNNLKMIPYVFADSKATNTNWYFQRESAVNRAKAGKESSKLQVKIIGKDRDEDYVLDLCDEVLKVKGSRQHKFDFLKGDSGRQLPVDIYYEDLKLVVEYFEYQHSNAVKHFDKPEKMTVSGVHRGEQRKIYDQRRRDVLSSNEIKLIEIDYSDFDCDERNRVLRDWKMDMRIVKNKLK